MYIGAIVEFFKHKIVSNIVVLACWAPFDQVRLIRQFSQYGMRATFSCDPPILNQVNGIHLQGVLCVDCKHELIEKVHQEHWSEVYKWLIISDQLPKALHKARYDADVILIKEDRRITNITDGLRIRVTSLQPTVYFYDVYVHPREGASAHPWAVWTEAGFQLTHHRQKTLRRLDLKKYPLNIATPVGHYSRERYNTSFVEYLEDETMLNQDPAIRSAYSTSMLLAVALNASDVLIATELWASPVGNNSMYFKVANGAAELAGGTLRILPKRVIALDYVVPIWPFSVGFTYLSERESSSNMYLEPFSNGVWWTCLAVMGLLILVQRLTSDTPREKDGAIYTVLTTWLQQDASAVPEGVSGRWAFIVLSVCAMLVHAYYTSAIVSALMSTGRGGLDSLRALADSKYAIASEDYEYLRYLYFDVETNWNDLEYLKKKKMTSKFYKKLERGVRLIEQGNTAFNSEYNQIYPHFKTFSDDKICKLQEVDIIPESLSWVTTTKRGQWTSTLRPTGAWLHETGLAKRLVSRLRIPKPPCRASLLAERVNLGDVAPLVALTASGSFISLIFLGLEILAAKWKKNGKEKRSLVNKRASEDVVELEIE